MESNQKEIVYLSLGSNLGDREANLEAVFKELPPQVTVLASSSIYQTEPWGFRDQPDFLNQVIQTETVLSPWELLAYLKKIEKKIGRKPSFLFGPRLVDIDILLYGDQVVHEEELIIPHEKMFERAFVLVPLAEIAPGLMHPKCGMKISDLLNTIDTSGVSLLGGNQVENRE
jgi:2-amino-4-hydroxy-6-hydroxymethyldihydropteridine diphosphokinase